MARREPGTHPGAGEKGGLMSARLALLVAVFFIAASALAGLVPAAEDPIVGDYGRCALPARTGGAA